MHALCVCVCVFVIVYACALTNCLYFQIFSCCASIRSPNSSQEVGARMEGVNSDGGERRGWALLVHCLNMHVYILGWPQYTHHRSEF